jgi:hypothetical protein
LPGDAINFSGSIIVAPPPPNPLKLYVRLCTNAVVGYWSTNSTSYALQSKTDLSAGTHRQLVGGPSTPAGFNSEYREPFTSLASTKFFRLQGP